MPSIDFTMLFLGLLLGMRHAFDPDHVLAVSQFVQRSRGIRGVAMLAISWALGHSFVLCLFTWVAFFSLTGLPAESGIPLLSGETPAGIILILLGTYSLYRIIRPASADEGVPHFHFRQSHEIDTRRELDVHDHGANHADHKRTKHHPAPTPWRKLRLFAVGAVHGLAGSGAFIGLSLLTEAPSAAALWGNIASFTIGSTVGMALFAVGLYIGMVYLRRKTDTGFAALVGLTGLASIGYGFTLL